MIKLISAFAHSIWKREEGLTTVEYAVAGGIIVAAVIAGFQLLGGNVGKVINNIAVAIGAIPNP